MIDGELLIPANAKPDWRDNADYRPLLALGRPGFAWEFLRRNPVYRAEARRALRMRARRSRSGPLTIDAPPGGAARWGLCFPGTTRTRCPHRLHGVACGS
ncbi:transcriptional regulator domain-containing protein [Sphingomonas sp. JC676]|uniref:transcriptional regulator domain-containing protein n=1 Tax=Sphingomonas sp. JC676 TaxID=2768065 RepID=UPI0039777F29